MMSINLVIISTSFY